MRINTRYKKRVYAIAQLECALHFLRPEQLGIRDSNAERGRFLMCSS